MLQITQLGRVGRGLAAGPLSCCPHPSVGAHSLPLQLSLLGPLLPTCPLPPCGWARPPRGSQIMDFSREEAKGADTGLEGGEVGGVRSSAR